MSKTLFEFYSENLKKCESLNIPEIELRMILCEINKLSSMSAFYLNKNDEILNEIEANSFLKRLFNGEPVQYIIGKSSFLNYEIEVNEDVLIPRMETEEVTLFAISKIKEKFTNPSIIDLCTGSGCIGLAISSSLKCKLYASDISNKALSVAKRNFAKYGVSADLFEGNLLIPFIEKKIKVDVIISNPPYIINKNDIDERSFKYEPVIALYPGEDDVYDFYHKILNQAEKILNPGGIIVLEIGYDMVDGLKSVLNMNFPHWKYDFIKDINNNFRILFIEDSKI